VAADIKAFVFAITQTTTQEAFEAVINEPKAKELIKELHSQWPDEFANVKNEKEQHAKRLQGNSIDPEQLIDDLEKKMRSEQDPEICQEMFKDGKRELLASGADVTVIAEYERVYNEHCNNLLMEA
jgi:Skp family chaperone for outer membrane proteins